METRKVTEKISYRIHNNNDMGTAAVERAFKDRVRMHVIVDQSIVDELTASKESWKATIEKYDIPVFAGSS